MAALAGVSTSTVSLVLNNKGGKEITDATRSRVLECANSLGYIPNASARALITGRTHRIGFVFPLDPDMEAIKSTAFSMTLSGVLQEISNSDYKLLIIPHRATSTDSLQRSLREAGVDGGFMLGSKLVGQGSGSSEGIMITRPDSPKCTTIGFDHEQEGRLVVEHLVALGHRDIVLLGSYEEISSEVMTRRLTGMAEPSEQHSAQFKTLSYQHDQSSYAVSAIESILELYPLPTAVILTSSSVARGVIEGLALMGIAVPRDLSVICFDLEHPTRRDQFALTTTLLPFEQAGRLAFRSLVAQLVENGNLPPIDPLPVEILVGDSTARASKR